MLIISPNKEPHPSEKAVLNRLRNLNGIAITGVYLNTQKNSIHSERETDIIVITPHRIIIIEVKGVRKGFSGNVLTPLNDEWTIAGEKNSFYHSPHCKNPYSQVKEQAQRFIECARHLPYFVSPHSLVVIVSNEKTKVLLEKPVINVGNGKVCLSGNTSLAIQSFSSSIVDIRFVKLFLKQVLKLETSMPTNSQLRAQRFLPYSAISNKQEHKL